MCAIHATHGAQIYICLYAARGTCQPKMMATKQRHTFNVHSFIWANKSKSSAMWQCNYAADKRSCAQLQLGVKSIYPFSVRLFAWIRLKCRSICKTCSLTLPRHLYVYMRESSPFCLSAKLPSSTTFRCVLILVDAQRCGDMERWMVYLALLFILFNSCVTRDWHDNALTQSEICVPRGGIRLVNANDVCIRIKLFIFV